MFIHFIVRKKRGSIKFSPTNKPVGDKSIELVTEPAATHEYFLLEANLMTMSNDDGGDDEGQSEVEENEEEEEDMEQQYENMCKREEDIEQQYEDMKRSIQDNNEEGETREMEIKVEMREEAIENENPIGAVYAIISKKN